MSEMYRNHLPALMLHTSDRHILSLVQLHHVCGVSLYEVLAHHGVFAYHGVL